ncbi:MAG: hypothetical protein JKY95_13505 [Planctomycetaceae bacterium]|nr:hypothetical protein [Planctomycetaceae bacterium]
MLRASNLFNDEQQASIKQAVIAAEAHTSCEIVPVVATSSGRYDRAEDVIGLWLAVIAAVTIWILFPHSNSDAGSWSSGSLFTEVLILIVTIVIAFIVGAIAGSRLGLLRRLFIPQKQMQEEVSLRARQVFFDNRVHHTSGATGLLIYVSLFEHIAIVLGDQEILDHPDLGQPFLDQLCQQLTQSLHQGHPTEAICETITQAGQQLSAPLPRESNDINELQDALVLID